MIYLRYLWSLLRHKWFVLVAGLMIGSVPVWRLAIHDWSKFTPAEFGRYARWHFGGDRDRAEWAKAWHHHQRSSPHHPEYWLLSWRGSDPEFYDGIGQRIGDYIVVLPMPAVYVREFIADCMGASKAYTGSWDIALWLNENGRKWHLHEETIGLITEVMIDLGYILTDNCDWSWVSGNRVRR